MTTAQTTSQPAANPALNPAVEIFGTCLVATVSPMKPDGSLDYDSMARLTDHLIDTGCDGIVVNGTTGESATMTTDESLELVAFAVEQAKGRARIIAGVGSNDTTHSVAMARRAAEVGADGLLLVSPYYNKPTQRGLIAHCHTVADTTDLPVMLYDIPGRTGIPFTTPTLLELAKHPNIRAVKDAKGDQWAATQVMAATDLAFYCGADEVNLPFLAIGASGVVSVVGHVASAYYKAMIGAVATGDLATARRIHVALIPLVEAIMNTSQGAIMAKAALAEQGVIEHATVRLPLVESLPEELAKLRAALAATPSLETLIG